MEYLDFDLHIGRGSGPDYPVTVLKSPVGEARATLRFPFDAVALASQLQGLELAVLKSGTLRRDVVMVTPEQDPVVGFGRRLFEALFADHIEVAFRRSQDRARSEGKGLRVRLRIDAPGLSSLPWEFLYDASGGDFVCLSSDTPLVRYLEFSRPPEALMVQPPIVILGMVASPNDRATLNVDHEILRMEQATSGLQAVGILRIDWLKDSTWRNLQRTLRKADYHVFHFVGHGGFDEAAGEGVLAFTNEAGGSQLLGATELGSLLADERSLRLVVLNSCLGAKGNTTDVFSSTSATLVRRGVPAVIAMQYEISDLAALEFSRSLYEAIADGMPIDASVAEARKAVRLSARNSVEWGTPVLHMRSPDGVLFKVDRSRTGTFRRPTGVMPAPAGAPTVPARAPAAATAAPAAAAPVVSPSDATRLREPVSKAPTAVPPASASSATEPAVVAPKQPHRRWMWAAAAVVVMVAGGLTAYLKNLQPAPPVQTVAVEGTSAAPSTPAPASSPIGPLPEMVAIPAGTFTMGSTIGEDGRSRNEGPARVVSVPAFELGKYEVTVEQFQAYADNPTNKSVTVGGCSFWNGKWAQNPNWSWRSPGFEQTRKDPVVCVSWEDAQRYVRWLNQVSKKSYRLASEAEWEYAARASTTGPRYWDNLLDTCRYANLDHAPPNCDDDFEKTAPVDRPGLVPNAFGLHDMLGNVTEWTADCGNSDYSGAPVKGEAWTAGNCASKMARGGAWIHGLREVRSAYRVSFSLGFRANVVGFRVARTLP